MSMHTRCTHCEAVFRVTLLQLQSSSGRVRCGVCREVFDAFVHLRAADPPPPETAPLPRIDVPDEPSPPGDPGGESPVVRDAEPRDDPEACADGLETPAEQPPAMAGDTAAAETPPGDRDAFVMEEIGGSAPPEGEPVIVPVEDTPGEAEGWPSDDEAEGDPSGTVAHGAGIDSAAAADILAPRLAVPPPPARRQRWPLIAGVSAAVLLLAGQATYRFRTPIATSLPALRPALERACAVAGCEIPLPRLPERLVIETSDLQALDPSRPNRVVLAMTVRNAATMAQAYPMLELSLTDARDKLTARKVFGPDEYLDPPPAKGSGLGADAEFSVRMQLDIGDIEASGYRLYLFHR